MASGTRQHTRVKIHRGLGSDDVRDELGMILYLSSVVGRFPTFIRSRDCYWKGRDGIMFTPRTVAPRRNSVLITRKRYTEILHTKEVVLGQNNAKRKDGRVNNTSRRRRCSEGHLMFKSVGVT